MEYIVALGALVTQLIAQSLFGPSPGEYLPARAQMRDSATRYSPIEAPVYISRSSLRGEDACYV